MEEKITFVSQPTINNLPMKVDGRGLRELAEITSKAEIATDKILVEVDATMEEKCQKSFVPGELRPFIKALKVLEAAVERAAKLVQTNPMLFDGIEEERTKVAWKEVTVCNSDSRSNLLTDVQMVKAMRQISHAFLKMINGHGTERYIRMCRKYAVRVLRRIVFHYGVSLRSKLCAICSPVIEPCNWHGGRSSANMERANTLRRRR